MHVRAVQIDRSAALQVWSKVRVIRQPLGHASTAVARTYAIEHGPLPRGMPYMSIRICPGIAGAPSQGMDSSPALALGHQRQTAKVID